MARFHLTYRTRLGLGILLLLGVAFGGPGFYVLERYRQSQFAAVNGSELEHARAAAARLGMLLQIAGLTDIESVAHSRDLILVADPACETGKVPRTVVSEAFQGLLREMELSPVEWTQSLGLFKSCAEFQARLAAGGPGSDEPLVVPTELQLKVPYVAVLLKGAHGPRFALLAMENFETVAGNTLFVLDGRGRTVWAADGAQYLSDSLAAVKITPELLHERSQTLFGAGVAKAAAPVVQRMGTEGKALVSLARIPAGTASGWSLVSLTYAPTALAPVERAVRQIAFLGAGFILLFVFFARRTSSFLLSPLQQLQESAESVAKGDYSRRLPVIGTDEISGVADAFNRMSQEVENRMELVRANAELGNELKLAQKVQQLFLPAPAITRCGHRIAAVYRSATQCGGDWWGTLDVPRPGGGTPLLLLLQADVAGHGAASALLTAFVRGALSMVGEWVKENPAIALQPDRLVSAYHRTLFEATQGALTMTFFIALIDSERGELAYLNAGHPKPYLLESAGPDPSSLKPRQLSGGGSPLGGTVGEVPAEVLRERWRPGSRLFVFTDGLVEGPVAEGKRAFNRRALSKTLQDEYRRTGAELLQRVLNRRDATLGGLPEEDDVTLIVCEAPEAGGVRV